MPRSLALLPLLGLLALAACDTAPMPTEPDGGIGDGGGAPLPVEPDGGIGDGAGEVDTCGLAGLQEFIGQDASTVTATLFTSPIRIVRPGDMVTMDFNPARINFRLGPDERVAEITCG
jgi:hypothetical protein